MVGLDEGTGFGVEAVAGEGAGEMVSIEHEGFAAFSVAFWSGTCDVIGHTAGMLKDR